MEDMQNNWSIDIFKSDEENLFESYKSNWIAYMTQGSKQLVWINAVNTSEKEPGSRYLWHFKNRPVDFFPLFIAIW